MNSNCIGYQTFIYFLLFLLLRSGFIAIKYNCSKKKWLSADCIGIKHAKTKYYLALEYPSKLYLEFKAINETEKIYEFLIKY